MLWFHCISPDLLFYLWSFKIIYLYVFHVIHFIIYGLCVSFYVFLCCVSLNFAIMLCAIMLCYFVGVFFFPFSKLSSASSELLSLCFLSISFLSSSISNYVCDFTGRNNYLNKIFKFSWNSKAIFICTVGTVFPWVFLLVIWFFSAFFHYSYGIFAYIPYGSFKLRSLVKSLVRSLM